ncbi:copper-zinc superoxide dismutase [Microthyrium microscopicum]|uniref:Superoxide dismutase [Cu-Zn] n=1 Tax=Microthyrium microscopicum TaxID=703497 RepID=A0A6A6UVF6_9PEZI|nr:copper-zinc superoxide dismutase [Microthyrium microscopicum]
MKSAIVLSLLTSLALAAPSAFAPIHAKVALKGDTPESKVAGTITLSQESPDAATTITYDITGLTPNAERGFHVHTSGDIAKGCAGAGGHYNPFNKDHGAPTDADRHVGDLGNIKSDAKGEAKGTITDKLVKLSGPESVLNRAIVVHAGTDDLGKGTSADSKKTGNAGGRPACGVITAA